MSEPRVMTEEEVRDRFLTHIASIVTYWEKESRVTDVRGKLEGVTFSILAVLDGSAVALPGFRVMPNPHESDETYCRDKGENWYPSDVDIAGGLHEIVHRYFKE